MSDYLVPIETKFIFQESVIDKDLSAAPGSPVKGDRYLVGTSTNFSTWGYYKIVTIAGSVGSGTNYQVKLLVGESVTSGTNNFHVAGHSNAFPSAKNDSGDLRFSSDGTAALDFWVESISGATPNRVATIWVEVAATLEANTTIYCYYGKTGAENVSNGANTFPLFDDFDGTAVDGAKWTSASGAGGTIVVASSVVTVTNSATNNSYAELASISSHAQGFAVRAYAKFNTVGTNRNQLFLGFTSAGGSAPYYLLLANEVAVINPSGTISPENYRSRHSGADESNTLDITTGSYNIYEVRRNAATNTTGIEIGGNSRTNSTQIPSGNLYGAIGTENPTTPDNPASVNVDFFFVRKYIATEPAYSSAAAEVANTAPWVGYQTYIAYCSVSGTPGTWAFITPRAGMICWVVDENLYYYYSGSAWAVLTPAMVGLGNVTNVAQLPSSYLDTDGALAANSDVKVASQKATKTYADLKAPIATPTFTGQATIPTINLTGGQITFPAAQSASAGANVLDDYEEGAWTAAFVCGTSGTITINAASGSYTKVGREVTVCGFFSVTSVSLPVGVLTLTGLPFTCANDYRFYNSATLYPAALNATATTCMIGEIETNSTAVTISHFTAGAFGAAAADMKAGSYFLLSATYFTT